MRSGLARLVRRSPEPLRKVAAVLGAVGAAFALTLAALPLAPSTVFLPFMPAIMFSAWYGGLAGGLSGAALAVWLTAIFLLPPTDTAAQVEFLVVASVVAVATSGLTAALRRTQRRLAATLSSERHLRAVAESASRTKSDFLAMLAHELRQPLGPLVTAATFIAQGTDPTLVERSRRVLDRQSRRLTGLIDDLTDVSRFHLGKLELRRTEAVLADIIDDVLQSVRPLAVSAGQRLSARAPAERVVLHVDVGRVQQILSNLLVNAIKYTDPGGEIELSARVEGEEVVLCVRDSGRGISAEALPTVFELFRQVRASDGGLGIGLALVKAFAEAHGGTVVAYSPGLGHGTEFVVRLPALDHANAPAGTA